MPAHLVVHRIGNTQKIYGYIRTRKVGRGCYKRFCLCSERG